MISTLLLLFLKLKLKLLRKLGSAIHITKDRVLKIARTAPQTGPVEQIDCQRDSVRSCSCKSGAALTPLRRSWNGDLKDHFYTGSRNEQLNYVGLGYKVEADMGFIALATPSDCTGIGAIYRMFNPETNDHFYTRSYVEMLNSLRRYSLQSVAIGYCMPGPGCGLIPLHRLWNAGTSDHLYTIDDAEKDREMQAGYTDEGILCYVWSSLDATDC